MGYLRLVGYIDYNHITGLRGLVFSPVYGIVHEVLFACLGHFDFT